MKTEEKDWTIPEGDIIHVPDRLDQLFNRLGMQLRFHTISKRNEMQVIANMTRIADEHASTLNRKVLEENEKLKEVLNRCDKTFGHLNKIFIALEEADQNELPELIKQIDLDLPCIQVQIKSLLSESSQGTKPK
jgi:hypothetical protein